MTTRERTHGKQSRVSRDPIPLFFLSYLVGAVTLVCFQISALTGPPSHYLSSLIRRVGSSVVPPPSLGSPRGSSRGGGGEQLGHYCFCLRIHTSTDATIPGCSRDTGRARRGWRLSRPHHASLGLCLFEFHPASWCVVLLTMATSRVLKNGDLLKFLLESIRAIITVFFSVEGLHRPGGYHGEVLSNR
jgi:hypothetical protein